MNYEQFFNEATRLDLRLPASDHFNYVRSTLDNEALFQLPLLAMVILILSKGNSKPKFSELGQLVGECLERTVAGFKGSSQDIGWSANLRIRTVKALTFLERAGFVNVDEREGRLTVNDNGRVIIENVMNSESPLATALLIVDRSHENIRAERRIRAEV